MSISMINVYLIFNVIDKFLFGVDIMFLCIFFVMVVFSDVCKVCMI